MGTMEVPLLGRQGSPPLDAPLAIGGWLRSYGDPFPSSSLPAQHSAHFAEVHIFLVKITAHGTSSFIRGSIRRRSFWLLPSPGSILGHVGGMGLAQHLPNSVGQIIIFGGAMRQRIPGSHTPPCHRRMVITT